MKRWYLIFLSLLLLLPGCQKKAAPETNNPTIVLSATSEMTQTAAPPSADVQQQTTASTTATATATQADTTARLTTAASAATETTTGPLTGASATQTRTVPTTTAKAATAPTTAARTTTRPPMMTKPSTTRSPATTKKPATTAPHTTKAATTTTTVPVQQQCLISITCETALRSKNLDEAQRAVLPGNGVLLKKTAVTFEDGESVFDVLKRVCRSNGIPMEFSMTPVYQSAYIEGIGNLYEFDCGAQSGWMYAVNGVYPNFGCSKYLLKNGDVVTWRYTCSLGADIGGAGTAQQ